MSDAAARLPDAQMSLFDAPASPVADATTPVAADHVVAADPDRDARDFATDPRHNVVLEASAGTGKTSVLVWRFIRSRRASSLSLAREKSEGSPLTPDASARPGRGEI